MFTWSPNCCKCHKNRATYYAELENRRDFKLEFHGVNELGFDKVHPKCEAQENE